MKKNTIVKLIIILFFLSIKSYAGLILIKKSMFRAEVVITSNPSDAEIYFDDVYNGKGTASMTYKVAEIVTVTVKKIGYKTKTIKLQYKPRKNSTNLNLNRGRNFYTIVLDKDDTYLSVSDNNNSQTNTTKIKNDIILKNNGEQILAKIIEVNTFEIKYKNFDYIDGPTIILPLSEINYVKYPNGKIETFKNKTITPSQNETSITSQKINKKEIDIIENNVVIENKTKLCKWCTSLSECIDVKLWHGTNEGKCDNFSKIINKTNLIITYKICVLKEDGTWDCKIDEIKENEKVINYHCDSKKDFQYKIWVAYNEILNQACEFPNP